MSLLNFHFGDIVKSFASSKFAPHPGYILPSKNYLWGPPSNKAELPLEGIIFALNFLPWEFLLVKKLEIEKTKTTKYSTFKTDIIKVVLVILISNLFTNENSQGRKLSGV